MLGPKSVSSKMWWLWLMKNWAAGVLVCAWRRSAWGLMKDMRIEAVELFCVKVKSLTAKLSDRGVTTCASAPLMLGIRVLPGLVRMVSAEAVVARTSSARAASGIFILFSVHAPEDSEQVNRLSRHQLFAVL